ncbi:dienelactone hydrolase family protein [Pseudocnuella soli]|uniref:dienelactone hydrolase family protein n=1 Tax=Pseudocnuella soli TaxID=2502779 RepID=UPI001EFF682C|nr:dienelactone hydrolase family protein [Pseudocnuella soli]
MSLTFRLAALLLTAASITACNNAPIKEPTTTDSTASAMNKNADIREEPVSYTSGGTTLAGFVAYDAARNDKRPVVLVVHEWWGLTDYPRMRARQLAQMGYLAMAVDMYGDGKIAANPDEAQKMATPFYQNPQEAKARLDAALAKALSMPQADTTKTAAIGYCFGGSMVLNAAKLGSNFDGVVSFHGGLEGVPPSKEALKAKVLVAHGGADNFVPETQVAAFKKSMDSVGADYEFKVYPNATHAFTNRDADKKAAEFGMPIRYNGAADTASWNDMKAFFTRIF